MTLPCVFNVFCILYYYKTLPVYEKPSHMFFLMSKETCLEKSAFEANLHFKPIHI